MLKVHSSIARLYRDGWCLGYLCHIFASNHFFMLLVQAICLFFFFFFLTNGWFHDDAIKWKHFPCYWTFVRGIHWSLVNSPHKGPVTQSELWCFLWSALCIIGWVNNREAGDLRRTHYDVTVMHCLKSCCYWTNYGLVIWYGDTDQDQHWLKVMVCCLMAPNHYLDLCWCIIIEVLWYSPERTITTCGQTIIFCM